MLGDGLGQVGDMVGEGGMGSWGFSGGFWWGWGGIGGRCGIEQNIEVSNK